MGRVIRILKIALGILLVGTVALAVAVIVLDEPLPESQPGPEAEALADRIMKAANVDAWNAGVGAVQWSFAGRRKHLWDRQRSLARVEWPGYVALLDLNSEAAHIMKEGQILEGPAKAEARETARSAWINDSFWLNPLAKLKDEGTRLGHVDLEAGGQGLLITYSGGGVTPGDSYLWTVGEDGLPTGWKMWVDIFPIGGIEVSWEGWQTLPGGAKVSTRHEGLRTLMLSDIKSASSTAELVGGEDPFEPLLGAQKAQPTSRPATHSASQPAATSQPAPAPQPPAAPQPSKSPNKRPAPVPAVEEL